MQHFTATLLSIAQNVVSAIQKNML